PCELCTPWSDAEVENGDGRGVVARKVDKDGPAAKAGIQVGDLVQRVGTYDVGDRTAFTRSICSFDPDERIPLAISRDGKRRDVTLTPISVTKSIADRLGLSLA